MTPLETALAYAAQGWPVHPCQWRPGQARKRPLIAKWPDFASTDRYTITSWWRRWPEALIGVPTGTRGGVVVLDIDVKDDLANGFDTLDDLGHAILPDTPMAHTASGGLHLYFANPACELRNSAGLLGPGLDVRGLGGFVIVPSPGSGYEWDPVCGQTTTLAPAPDWLWPVKPSRPSLPAGPVTPVHGLSPYGRAALEMACEVIAKAPVGKQERTLNSECFSIGTAVGAGIIPGDIALRALLRAAHSMPDYDARLPWRQEEIEAKVIRSFRDGVAHPREVRRAVA